MRSLRIEEKEEKEKKEKKKKRKKIEISPSLKGKPAHVLSVINHH
jgi:hypothetical protein